MFKNTYLFFYVKKIHVKFFLRNFVVQKILRKKKLPACRCSGDRHRDGSRRCDDGRRQSGTPLNYRQLESRHALDTPA